MNQGVTDATIKQLPDFYEYETAQLGPFLNYFFRRNPDILNKQDGHLTTENIASFIKILITKSNLNDYYNISLLITDPGEFGHHGVVYPIYNGIFYAKARSISKVIRGMNHKVFFLLFKLVRYISKYNHDKNMANLLRNFSTDLLADLHKIINKMVDYLPSIIIYASQNRKEND